MPYEEILNDQDKLKILSRIIAHLMGDGCVTDRYFAYYNKDETLLDNFEKDVSNLFNVPHFIKGKVKSGTKLVQVQNKPILIFLKSLVEDYRSFSLSIPKFIKDKTLKSEFLRALYDDEGCVSLRVFRKTGELSRNLDIGSKSKTFLEEIKEILENDFNIKCNRIGSYGRFLNGKHFTTFKLSITGKENFVIFRDQINFSHPIKKEKLDRMINSYIRK